ncbi:uncharacterized protein EDB91DRAFT_1056259 [Suillus paluster]|uniref:uncharacterized protein n=1 Tax=Suillus paluster TaxID=48578 RepID=UPI001B8630AF|nr:uncharacterized protein EDB91DRAFT_1056259 [Suillus paluster]KAG1735569.1 hypothetical protein EDB91DRAFT_1056259 [Suillus paluster]
MGSKSFEYIELWYFSPDGCKHMADKAKLTVDGTFGFTKVDDFIALKAVATFKPSHKAIQDHSLEWRQFDMAKNSFLLYINKLNWPEKHQHALTMFFMNIISHPQRSELFGEPALLLYTAHVHWDWHDTSTLYNAFDIGIFNSTLLKGLAEEVWNRTCLESLTEVRLTPIKQCCQILTTFCFFHNPSNLPLLLPLMLLLPFTLSLMLPPPAPCSSLPHMLPHCC